MIWWFAGGQPFCGTSLGSKYGFRDMHGDDAFSESAENLAQIDSGVCRVSIRVQSIHFANKSKQSSWQIWVVCLVREHGFTWRIQLIACHACGSHLSMSLIGKFKPGKLNDCVSFQSSVTVRAALSAFILQLRNNSVGRLLKFVQNESPSQPSSHGSSTEKWN